MKKRFPGEKIIVTLRQAEEPATPVRGGSSQHGVSEQTFCCWRRKHGGLEAQ